MKTKSTFRALLTLALLAVSNIASAQGTAFTYQGRLGEGGGPAHGTYDFRFVLYDLQTGGSAVSSAVTNGATVVSNGLFTVTLDFGAGVFTGPDRWLEIGVRTNGASTFTTLSPRQPLLPTPYAMHASNADLLDGMNFTAFAQAAHNHSAADIVSGVLAPARGGTGIDTSATPTGSLLRTSGTGTWSPLAPGANGQVLKISGGQPIWSTDNNSGGTVTAVNTGAGLTGGPITTNGTIAIDTAVVPRLGANNIFSASNVFTGVLLATNANNSFAGTFTGSGGALSNLNASALSGTVPGGAIAGTYSNAVNFTNGANSFRGSFVGNGTGISNVNATSLGGLGADQFWRTAGNAATTPNVNFVGTTDSQPLHFKIGGVHALRFEPDPRGANVPNIIGGFSGNAISTNSGGGGNVIVGGGYAGIPNIIQSNASGVFIGAGSLNLVGTNANDVVIAGGFGNTVEAYQSVISGGGFNSIRSVNSGVSVIGGGSGNIITNVAAPGGSATIGGGFQNYNSGWAGTIAGGWQNSVAGTSGFIGGGTANNNSATYGTIGGGVGNFISNSSPYTAIGGGLGNGMQGDSYSSTISGGYQNLIEASAFNSAIGGGYTNVIASNAPASTISGGTFNLISAGAAIGTIGGGTGNRNGGAYGTIAGGAGNNNESQYSSIGGGANNTIAVSGFNVTIGGGANNLVGTSANGSTISGGTGNSIQPFAGSSFIGGGQANAIGRGSSVIGGGIRNTNLANTSTIAGGAENAIGIEASDSTIGGGILNRIHTNADWSTIAGGRSNTISTNTEAGTIAGGFANTLEESTRHATIGGGSFNTIATNAQGGTIAGGSGNYIDVNATGATIGGGLQNWVQTNGVGASIAGGSGNVADGRFAQIPGGRFNQASGTNSLAAGRRAKALHPGAFVWADTTDADFLSTATNQFNVRASGGVRLETSGAGATLDGLPLLSGVIGNAQIANNAISTSKLTDGAVTAAKIAGGQVVKSLNSLKDDVALLPGPNMTIAPAGNSLILDSPTDWHVTGNAGTSPGFHFVGTTDNQPLELKVDNRRALRLEPTGSAPNVIGGSPINTAAPLSIGIFIGGGEQNTVAGNWTTLSGGDRNTANGNWVTIGGGLRNEAVAEYATIGGGRIHRSTGPGGTVAGGENNRSGDHSAVGGGLNNESPAPLATVGGGEGNISAGDHATVGGGQQNVSSGRYASVPGGHSNTAAGDFSFAAGRRAKANHHGTFVWADSTDADFESSANNQFLVRTRFAGINRATPLSGAEYFGIRAPVTNQYGGMYIETAGTGMPFYGYASPGSLGYAWTYLDGTDANKWKLDVSGTRLTVTQAGNVGIGTTSPASALHVVGEARATVFTPTSDRAAKDNFRPVDTQQVLAKVAALPIARWNFKTLPGAEHIGPVAQDFRAAFGLGADDKHIATVDADGVALAAIQGLNQKVEKQAAELRSKDAELRAVKERLTDLENVIAKLATTLK